MAHQDVRIAIDRARVRLELADEAIVHAAKVPFLGVTQVQAGEQAPHADREATHQRLLDLAEPAHELSGEPPGNPVGDQEIEILAQSYGFALPRESQTPPERVFRDARSPHPNVRHGASNTRVSTLSARVHSLPVTEPAARAQLVRANENSMHEQAKHPLSRRHRAVTSVR